MNVELIRHPELLNWFGSHPDIVEGIGGAVDFTHALRETNVFLFGEHGGFCFEWTAPGTYEVHAMITRSGRGIWGFRAALDARSKIAAMGAQRLWARVRDDQRALAVFTRRAGFIRVDRRALYPGGVPVTYDIFEWRNETCPQQS
jgi:hypothetical protein